MCQVLYAYLDSILTKLLKTDTMDTTDTTELGVQN